MGVDLLAGQFLHLVERHIDAFHAAHLETCVAKIFGEDGIELFREIGGADEALGLERVERIHMVLRHAHDRHFVFLLPGGDDLGFALAAEHHERRRAMGMDEVAVLLGQHRHELLVVRHHGVKLVRGAALDIEEQRNEADAFGNSRQTSSVTPGRMVGLIMPTTPRQLENAMRGPFDD